MLGLVGGSYPVLVFKQATGLRLPGNKEVRNVCNY